MDDVTGGEVLTRVLVQRLVELPDEFLEDSAHREVAITSGWRFTFGSPNRCTTWNRSPASSSLVMVLSKSNLSSTSRMLGLNPAM